MSAAKKAKVLAEEAKATAEGDLERTEKQMSAAKKAKVLAEEAKATAEGDLERTEKEMSAAKKAKALAEEAKATAEGDLERTEKQIVDDKKSLKDLQHECMTTAESYEQETNERKEELGALAMAKKILVEKTGAASERTYGLVQSFLQVKMKTHMRSSLSMMQASDKIVALLQQLSKQE